MVNLRLLLLACLLSPVHPYARAQDQDADTTINAAVHIGLLGLAQQSNPASPYGSGAARPGNQMRRSLDLKLHARGWNVDASLRSTPGPAGGEGESTRLNQAYYDSEIAAGQGWTFGKKVIAWGMGQGFRPLDIVQRENRRQVEPVPLEGKPLIAWQYFTREGALTLVGQLAESPAGNLPHSRQALAAQWYSVQGRADVQLVARLGKGGEQEAGGGASLTLDDDWQAHAAWLRRTGGQQRRHNLLAPGQATLATGDPLSMQAAPAQSLAIAGLQWTQEAGGQGWGVLAEAWYDAQAWRRSDWQALSRLTQRQRTLAGQASQAAIDGNLAWSARAFNAPNLMRENLMLRASYEHTPHWSGALEWLLTPRDGGQVKTLSLQYSGQQQQWRLGLRELSGPPDAALAQSPLRRQVWLSWQLALN